MVTALRFGTIQRYELLNKGAGLLLPFLSYAAITSAIGDWDDVRRMLRVFVLGVVVENVIAVGAFLAAYFFGISNPFTRYGGLRLSGMLLDPNAYGGLLVVALDFDFSISELEKFRIETAERPRLARFEMYRGSNHAGATSLLGTSP
jgi:hypothetical protein